MTTPESVGWTPSIMAGASNVSKVGYRLLGGGHFLVESITFVGGDDANLFSRGRTARCVISRHIVQSAVQLRNEDSSQGNR